MTMLSGVAGPLLDDFAVTGTSLLYCDGDGRSAGAVSGGGADALGLDYRMRCRQPLGEQGQQRHRRGWGEAGQGAERAAHRAHVMFAVLVGRARFTMSAEQRQQTLLGAAGAELGPPLLRRLQHL